MDTNVEVPEYFLCPISLDIMQDPVTVVTGITYDRSSIERWLFSDNNTTCPVTSQPLPKDSELTPNHTLRRLIQAWCTINSVDRIPTPKPILDRVSALSLLSDLSNPSSLNLVSSLASYNQSNRRTLLQAGTARFVLGFIISRPGCDKQNEVALDLLLTLRAPSDDLRPLVENNYDLIDALALTMKKKSTSLRSVTVSVLKLVLELASSGLMERLKVEFFESVVSIITDRNRMSTQATKTALHLLLKSSQHGRNMIKMVEAGAVKEVIELELEGPERRRTELAFGVLEQLCSCAEGREHLVGHGAGLAVVAERVLRVSPGCDERAVGIFMAVCKYSGTEEVVREMVKVGGVSKLCFVLQADCSSRVKEKARWVLRLHSAVWKESNCFNFYLLTNLM